MSVKPGALRFNTDSMKLEIFRGSSNYNGSASMAGIGTLAAGQWEEIQATSPDVQTGGTRGLFMGGMNEPSPNAVYDVIEFITIPTTGNSTDFGNLAATEQEGAALGGHIRGYYFGGDPADNEIETIVFASLGNATDYGDLAANSKGGSGTGSRTRGIAFLGNGGNVINYFALTSTGSGLDFGDATTNATSLTAACGSPTRAVVGGGSPASNSMGYVTISTLGDTADFGDLTDQRGGLMAASNAVRGLFAGGFAPSDGTNLIDYITIATLGDATNFGDLTRRTHYAGASASSTRMVIGGGDDHPSGGNYSNVIDYVQIMSEANAIDFGDLTAARSNAGAASNGHGGL